ncbi:hypothetical protein AKJ16_DCAP02804 [Drosera capensis]
MAIAEANAVKAKELKAGKKTTKKVSSGVKKPRSHPPYFEVSQKGEGHAELAELVHFAPVLGQLKICRVSVFKHLIKLGNRMRILDLDYLGCDRFQLPDASNHSQVCVANNTDKLNPIRPSFLGGPILLVFILLHLLPVVLGDCSITFYSISYSHPVPSTMDIPRHMLFPAPIPPPMRRRTGLLSLCATGAITSVHSESSICCAARPIAFISSTNVVNTLATFKFFVTLSNLCSLSSESSYLGEGYLSKAPVKGKVAKCASLELLNKLDE